MSYLIAVGGCLIAAIGTGLVVMFLFGSFPDMDFDWPEDEEKLWPTP